MGPQVCLLLGEGACDLQTGFDLGYMLRGDGKACVDADAGEA